MKVIQIDGEFGLDHLRLLERKTPVVSAGCVLLKMRAVSLNFRDLLMVKGAYNPRQPLPLIPCSDGVGTIVEVGEGVEDVWIGKRVTPLFAQGWLAGRIDEALLRESTLGGPVDGTLAEYMVVPVSSVVSPPEHLSDEEAASLPCAAVTAWNALTDQASIRAGDSVLVLGSGGVSLFALQFAKLAGARVLAISSSDEKLVRLKDMGAEIAANYRSDAKWGKRVLEATEGLGVDYVVEVGGAGTLSQSLRSVRMGGTILLIGVLAGSIGDLNVIPILMRNIRLQGVFVGNRDQFESMNRALSSNPQVSPVIDRVFGFEEAVEAFRYLESGAHFGKVCIRLAT